MWICLGLLVWSSSPVSLLERLNTNHRGWSVETVMFDNRLSEVKNNISQGKETLHSPDSRLMMEASRCLQTEDEEEEETVELDAAVLPR